MLTAALCASLWLAATIADEPRFQHARSLYTELEYEKALELFQVLATEARPTSEQGLLQLWSGLCLAGMGDMESAERTFQRGLELDSTLSLPVTVSPKLGKLFASLKEKAQSNAGPEPVATAPPGRPQTSGSGEPVVSGESTGRLSTLFVGGSSAAALGAIAVLGGTVLSGLAFADLGAALDRSQFQDQAQASLDSANQWMTGALVCYGVGTVLFAAGAALATVDVLAAD